FLVFICHVITSFSAFAVFICLRIIACMIQREFIFSGVNNRFFIRSITMRENRINESSRVCSSENQTNFTNNTMHDIGPNLFQLIGENRKSRYITMLHKQLGVFTGWSIIKYTIGINTVATILK